MLIKENLFDSEVQQCKRKYWLSMQKELLLESTNNQQQLWKKIGKIGVTENRKSSMIFLNLKQKSNRWCKNKAEP
jgi:hypothetical protein